MADDLSKVQDMFFKDAMELQSRIFHALKYVEANNHIFGIKPINVSREKMAQISTKVNALSLIPFYSKGLEHGFWTESEDLSKNLLWDMAVEKVYYFEQFRQNELGAVKYNPDALTKIFKEYCRVNAISSLVQNCFVPQVFDILDIDNGDFLNQFLQTAVIPFLNDKLEYYDIIFPLK